MRFLRGGAGNAGSGSGSAPGSPQQQGGASHQAHLGFGTPGAPQRTISDPLGGGSSAAGHHRPHSLTFGGGQQPFGAGPASWQPRPEMHRARSLESAPIDHFRLGDSALPASAGGAGQLGGSGGSSPSQPALFRSFSINAGAPVAEAAARKKSNGFLELLASQDSFIGND